MATGWRTSGSAATSLAAKPSGTFILRTAISGAYPCGRLSDRTNSSTATARQAPSAPRNFLMFLLGRLLDVDSGRDREPLHDNGRPGTREPVFRSISEEDSVQCLLRD